MRKICKQTVKGHVTKKKFLISLILHFGTPVSIWETNCEVLSFAKMGKLCLLQNF